MIKSLPPTSTTKPQNNPQSSTVNAKDILHIDQLTKKDSLQEAGVEGFRCNSKLRTSQESSDHQKLLKRSVQFFIGTLASRITGLGRDMATAYAFGAGPSIALLMTAFRFSNLPRRIFGEGALQSIIIAHYEKIHHISNSSHETASDESSADTRISTTSLPQVEDTPSDQLLAERASQQFYLDTRRSWALVLILFILASYFVIFILENIILKSLASLTISFYCKLMLPGLWFICMSAINDAYLKSRRRFLLSSFAPAAFNITWILTSILLADSPESSALKWLCVAIVGGFAAQWAITSLGARVKMQSQLKRLTEQLHNQPKKIVLEPLKPKFFSKDVRTIARPFLLGIIGVGALQINALIDTLFAYSAESTAPAYLWYAIRIEQAPLSLIALAISSASFPSIAQRIKKHRYNQARKLFALSYDKLYSLMLMICSALFALGLPALRIVYERGDYTAYEALRTSQCVWAYSLGLLAQALTFIYQNIHFTLDAHRFVTYCSLCTVALNLLLNTLFVSILGLSAAGVALATSIAASCQLYMLKWSLERTDPNLSLGYNASKAAKALVVTLLSLAVGLSINAWIYQIPLTLLMNTPSPTDLPEIFTSKATLIDRFWQLLLAGGVWALWYSGLSKLLRIKLPRTAQ